LKARLALQFGCSIAHIDKTVPSSDLTVFQALWEMEPWGYSVDNYHAGLIASTVAKFSGNAKEPNKMTSDLFMTPPPKAE
jgi:hypothetical protein